ncbi:hypothetical protein QAD02_000285 [Eretmocerus hayati]|uniref:Uncharacterized protein n=1 Tax=Eretmocerus hayati TaxID=131215 RepID=A0ACC2NEK3_9HYME|nr:hypothetical protein QAD02_000285 [Eretmocerus hayati]
MSTNDSLTKWDLVYLFYRVREPVYFPKGDSKGTCILDVSPDYLPEQYKGKASELLSRFGEVADVRRINIGSLLTDDLLKISLDQVLKVKRQDPFSLFIPMHSDAAARLIEIFLRLKDINELMAFSAYARDRTNPELFVYALSTALLHRSDTRDVKLPLYSEIFPEKFVPGMAIEDAKEIAQIFQNANDRIPIEIPRNFTGNDNDPEHRLAYFREDIGVNLHHWHWHLIYPFSGPIQLVNKNRRGELFYYVHHEMMARYNIERLCNQLNTTRRLLDWFEEIPEAYFPMLNAQTSGKIWPARVNNMKLSNIDRPDLNLRFDIETLVRWKDRIFEAIHKKRAISTDGTEIDLDNDQGIDVLGNMVEASILSPNQAYYGSIHNNGHNMIALIHDPMYKYLQTPAVMSETTTAMRDPIFYRWHAFIDYVFTEHKNTLTPYENQTLNFPGIQITGLEVCSYEDDKQVCRKQKNILYTFMEKTDIDLSRGLDFTPTGPILVRVTHLNHTGFQYNIKVRNTTGRQVRGTVRLFMAPVKGFHDFDLTLADQKQLMIDMDTFVAILDPGENTVVRKSSQSSVTIPFEQTFRNLELNRPSANQAQASDRFNFCGCGWPEYLLLPKGLPGQGYRMVLFAMITNYELDRVVQDRTPAPGQPGCKPSFAFCGLFDEKYPDKRPMGFPFDRPIRTGVESLEQFLTPNMSTTPVNIVHLEGVRNGRLVSSNSIPIRDFDVNPNLRNIDQNPAPNPSQPPTNIDPEARLVESSFTENATFESSLISRKPRLVGGFHLSVGFYPYVVSIQYEGLHFCGGTSISADTILTAGHCIINKWHEWMTVRSGSTNKYEGSIHKVVKMSYHENHTFVSKQNDIALLRIEPPLTYLTIADFVKLFDKVDEDLTNQTAFSLGWGRMKANYHFSSPTNLRRVDLQIISKKRCRDEYELMETVRGELKNNLCTHTYGKGNCIGDSGGPLMIDDRQVGVISWSFKCGTGPNVYTEVAAYLNWIQSEKLALSDLNRQPMILHPIKSDDEEYFKRGGSIARYKNANFVVSILDATGTSVCSGSVIGYALILTVAQCLSRKPAIINSGWMYEKSGGLNHSIISTIVHKDFRVSDESVPIHDIALIRVDPPLIFNFRTRIVRLPEAGKLLRPQEGATVYGFGTSLRKYRNNEEPKRKLHFQIVSIMDRQECRGINSYRGKNLQEKQICTSTGGGMCVRDLGSPLVIGNRLVGIFSWGDSQCADYRMPSVYTDVNAYLDWIEGREHKINDELR